MRQGMADKIGSDDYIFVPDHENRDTLKDTISKSFTHFWKQTGIQKVVSFKNLRKTHITRVIGLLGDKAKSIKHNNDKVAQDHYINELEILKPLKGRRLIDM